MYFRVNDEVKKALAENRPVVALESQLSHTECLIRKMLKRH